MSWRLVGGTLLVLLLVGCAPHMPKLASPAKVQDLRLSDGLVHSGSSMHAVANWWQPLLSRSEHPFLLLALAKNPDLAAAEARVRLATANLLAAGAQQSPRVDATGRVGVSRWTENQFYLPPYAGETSWNNALNLNFSYDLDFWGKERERIKEAQLRLQMAEQRHRAATLLLENAVLQQLVTLGGNAAVLLLLHQEQAILRQIKAIEQQRQQHGLADSLPTLHSAARLAKLQQEIIQETAKQEKNRQALAILCGVGTRLPKALQDAKLPLPAANWQSPTKIPTEWIAQRPDVQVRRSAIEVAAAAIHVARDAYYPNVNIVAFAGGLAAAGGLFTFLHPGSLQAGVGPALSLPLFTGGRLRGNFDASQAHYQLALAQYKKSLLQALQQVAAALADLQAASQEHGNLEQRGEILLRSARLQAQRYRSGLSNALPALDAQLQVIDNQEQQTRLNVHVQERLINLYAALGGRVVPKTWPSRHKTA